MTDSAVTGRAPARVDLAKRLAVHLVIIDDRDAFTNWAELRRANRLPQREVVYVERQIEHPVGQQLQWDELAADCMDAGSESLGLVSVVAVSHAHAAARVRANHWAECAGARMLEVIDQHYATCECGDNCEWTDGWIAIRIPDGSSDGELYADAETARSAQDRPEHCLILQIYRRHPWTPHMVDVTLRGAASEAGFKVADYISYF
jgi:hypothetical protein